MTKDFLAAYAEQLAYSLVDVTNCDHEPIARCGAIQSVGYFVALDPVTLLVKAVSENFCAFTGHTASQILGKNVSSFVTDDEGHFLEPQQVSNLCQKRNNVLKVNDDKGETHEFHASFNVKRNQLTIDLETKSKIRDFTSYDQLHELMHRIEAMHNLESDAPLICETIKAISDFDRVMIYRFHENNDGEVIAEAKSAKCEAFLNLHYPASDIPSQARALYLNSSFRMIVDTQALPVPILTVDMKRRSEIDMGASILRACSPIHIHYLLNMGVRSSFSLPIIVQNRLWGLISCHHYSAPIQLQNEPRSVIELISRIFAGRISNYIDTRRLLAKKQSLEFTHVFLKQLTDGFSPRDAFLATSDKLLSLIGATGTLVRIEGEDIRIGLCPDPIIIEQIIDVAKVSTSLGTWSTQSLKGFLNLDVSPEEAAGALVVPLSFGFEDMVIWFRPEAIRTVNWGGKPQKSLEEGRILEPRASFGSWAESIRDSSFAWTQADEEAAQFLLFNFIKGIFSKATALSNANKELERVTRAKDEFIGMVSHELRTPLSAIIGWLDILRDSVPFGNPDTKEAIDVIERNAKLQVGLINDLLDISRIISGKMRLNLRSNVRMKQEMQNIVESLRPTAVLKQIDVTLICTEDFAVTVDPDRLRQVVWNLATNAIKFTPSGGNISITTRLHNNHYEIVVADNGVGVDSQYLKSIFDRFNQVDGGASSKGGLGLGLSIVNSIVELHGGVVHASSDGIGCGSKFSVVLPLSALTYQPIESPSEGKINLEKVLKGRRVLMAEDDPDTGAALKFLIERMGATCVWKNDGQAALDALLAARFDLIISDIGMPVMNGNEFMKSWRATEALRGVNFTPAIAITAYATSRDRVLALENGFQSHIPKPIDKAELIAVITSLGLEKIPGGGE